MDPRVDGSRPSSREPSEMTRSDADGDVVAVDVAVVGGGPAGCAAAVFAGRDGLDTLVFDGGRSSLRQCAHVENYPGFPAGVSPETLYDLFHAHVEEAGCRIVPDCVESVTRRADTAADAAFVVETASGRRVAARRVVAATRYGGEYLRPLDDGEMFEAHEDEDGETAEHFDRSYAEFDGATPVDRLYVASPSDEADRQAVVAAGRGARVGLRVVEDARRDRGLPEPLVARYDWVRRESSLEPEWRDRDRWREWFDGRVADADLDPDEWEELREREIDRRLETYLDADERARRTARGQRRLLDHVDDELILERARELGERADPGE